MTKVSTSRDSVRFLHLADLHLMVCERDGACGPNDPACHPCIKAKILDGLHARLNDVRTRPELLLLAGDLTEACDILRQALVRHSEDVFVTPSPGRDWASRIKDYGRALVGEQFERFASETLKRSAGTQ